MDKARDWAVRCQLELKDHDEGCWTTLTYSDHYVPPTLQKTHLSAWLKRLRARHPNRTIRFFASGEYGDKTLRPHYHAILFGLSDDPSIQDTWPYGHVRVDPLSPAAIAYVAGYSAKKVGWKLDRGERVDPETGEVYEYQPPFIQMSRRPGIGGNAREHWKSWKESAIWHNRPVPVPRFLHDAYKKHASPQAIEKLQLTKQLRHSQDALGEGIDYEADRLKAAAVLALRKHNHQSNKRSEL